MIKPIPQYKGYFCSKELNRLVGIDENGTTDFKVVDTEDNPVNLKEFFKIEDTIYLSVASTENTGTDEEPVIEEILTHYSQKDGKLTVIESLPPKPEAGYSTYKSKNFIMETYQYQGETVSRIHNLQMKNQAAFKQICGYCETKAGLFFNVIESRIPGKLEGLYLYPIDRKAVVFINISYGTGFFW